jgi:hypothetical protein
MISRIIIDEMREENMEWLKKYFKNESSEKNFTNGELSRLIGNFVFNANQIAEQEGANKITNHNNTYYFTTCTVEIVYTNGNVLLRKLEKDIEVDYVKFTKVSNNIIAYDKVGNTIKMLNSNDEVVEFGFEYLLTRSNKIKINQ